MASTDHLTDARRMAGGARTRGMRTFRVWCVLYSYLIYGFHGSPDRCHEDGGWDEDKRDEDGNAEDGGLVEVAPEPLRVLISNVQSSETEKKTSFRQKTHMF